MLLSICSEPKILEIMRIVNIIINIIRIVVPILLIFILIFKLIQAMTSGNDDGLSKVKKNAPHNIVAAVVIFFIPVLVSLIVKLTFPNSDYSNCLDVKTKDEIALLYVEKMNNLVAKAEKSENIGDYVSASNYAYNIKDVDIRKAFLERLGLVKSRIDEAHKVVIEEEVPPEVTAPTSNNTETKKYVDDKEDPISKYVNVDAMNLEIARIVKSEGLYTRGAVTSVVKYVINELDKKNYKIPYLLGGSYNGFGVNPKWGTLYKKDNILEQMGLDCRYFVVWAYRQAGITFTGGKHGYVGSTSKDKIDNIYPNMSQVKPGDVIDKLSHIMLVLSKSGNTVTVAEAFGKSYFDTYNKNYGVVIHNYTFSELESQGCKGYNMDAIYNNTSAYCPSTSCHIPSSSFPSYYNF